MTEKQLAERVVETDKSNLLEAALGFALDDMDRGDDSQLLKRFRRPK